MFIAGAGAVGRVGRPGLSGNGARRPSFDVDFVGSGSLGAGAVFTRASTGTYYDSAGVLRTAGMNILFPSIPASPWSTNNGCALVPNSGIAPDGTNTMVKLNNDGANSIHCSVRATTIVASVPYTFSAYARIGEIRYLSMRFDDGVSPGVSAVFDLQTGVITQMGQAAGGATALGTTMQAVGNGIYRCSVSVNLNGPTLGRCSLLNFITPTGAGFPPYQSVAGEGCYVWGAQLEQGTFASPYAPTTTVANSGPRFDYDPVTLQLKGLLLEDASTNLFTDSTTGGAAWAIGGVAVAGPAKTANNVIAPDGTTTGTRLVYPAVSAAGNASTLQQSLIMTAVPHTMSVWLRGNVGGEITWICGTPDGVLYYRQQCVLTTAWQRFSVTTANLTAAAWFWIIGTDRRDAQQAATPAQTIYAWGGQIEALPYMSSHIPTTSVSVTRAQDVLFYPAAALTGFKPPGGSWFAEFDYFSKPSNSRVIGDAGGSGGGGITPVFLPPSPSSSAQYDGVAAMNAIDVVVANVIVKCASTWATGQAKACANGGAVNTSAALTTGYGLLNNIGIKIFTPANPGLSDNMSGHIRRVSYWPRVLSDTELQQVTT